jgi:hypothetical protein
MKTTIEISDHLLRRAKQVAQREGRTLRELTEEGLEAALRARERHGAYRVKPVVMNGRGLSPEFQAAGWDRIREAAYQGRGS